MISPQSENPASLDDLLSQYAVGSNVVCRGRVWSIDAATPGPFTNEKEQERPSGIMLTLAATDGSGAQVNVDPQAETVIIAPQDATGDTLNAIITKQHQAVDRNGL